MIHPNYETTGLLTFVKGQRIEKDYNITNESSRFRREIDLSVTTRTYVSEYIVDLRMDLWNIYIYSNISKPVVLGDIFTSILQTIPHKNIKQQNGYIEHSYQYPIYLSVSGDFFTSIKIKICDEKGRSIQLHHGKILITLEFVKNAN